MIITLEDAWLIDKDIAQDDLDALETMIRNTTNNNFQNTKVRFDNIKIVSKDSIDVMCEPLGLRVGDTVEINYSEFNDGLYVVDYIDGSVIQLLNADLITATVGGSMLTQVVYPADVRAGVKRLIKYDLKMGDKVGVKSESISRMNTTYYDVNSSESLDGYPAHLLSFTDKYRKVLW